MPFKNVLPLFTLVLFSLTSFLPEQVKGLDRPVIVECEPILEA